MNFTLLGVSDLQAFFIRHLNRRKYSGTYSILTFISSSRSAKSGYLCALTEANAVTRPYSRGKDT